MAHNLSSSLTCELKIVRAKNLEFLPRGNLFVRYYLVDENCARIRLSSREIASTSDPLWNENVSLECNGAMDTIGVLRGHSVAFELRWRSTLPVLGRYVRSKLLGSAEIAWKDVLESIDMRMEKWVTLERNSSSVVGLKPPALWVGMKVGASERVGMGNSRGVGSCRWKECSCRDCACGRDEEIFAIAAALVVL